MSDHKVVSDASWLEARKKLLAKEKEFTRLRDELTAMRQKMPWRKVEKHYEFDTPSGRSSLADLFVGARQLVVYHFMFGPDWEEGCPSCSFWADNYNGIDVHLAHRDTALLTISNTSISNIEAYKRRMGWTFKWVSSLGGDFNRDFNVSFSDEEMQLGQMTYNYERMHFPVSEGPGFSVFYRKENGDIFHTYSTYSRGLDLMNGAYNILDLTPVGRDEKGDGKYNMYWLKRHDQYES